MFRHGALPAQSARADRMSDSLPASNRVRNELRWRRPRGIRYLRKDIM